MLVAVQISFVIKIVLAAGDLETRLAPLSSGDDWILQIPILFVVLVVTVDRA